MHRSCYLSKWHRCTAAWASLLGPRAQSFRRAVLLKGTGSTTVNNDRRIYTESRACEGSSAERGCGLTACDQDRVLAANQPRQGVPGRMVRYGGPRLSGRIRNEVGLAPCKALNLKTSHDLAKTAVVNLCQGKRRLRGKSGPNGRCLWFGSGRPKCRISWAFGCGLADELGCAPAAAARPANTGVIAFTPVSTETASIGAAHSAPPFKLLF